ncbi:MAG: hypothetical protein QXR02_01415 [Acidilobaceae archaeon]
MKINIENYGVLNIENLNPKPSPLGLKCNPACPYYTCLKDSLVISKSTIRGFQVKIATCLLLGSQCIGFKCRYYACKLRANINGECMLVSKYKA